MVHSGVVVDVDGVGYSRVGVVMDGDDAVIVTVVVVVVVCCWLMVWL